MEKEETLKFKINPIIIDNYVVSINSITTSMRELKEQLSNSIKPITEQVKNINIMLDTLKDFSLKYPNEQSKIYIETIKQIMNSNNGMISSRMIEPLNISRQYLSIMVKNNEMEKISRGMYLSPKSYEDSYFLFQQKYKKAIFSHMNALYFHGLTEEFPYNYTITVPYSYHTENVNNKCNVFYVNEEIYEIGLCEVETPDGNKVRSYDLERSICDIIRSKNRMDLEQVKKSIREYVKRKDKNISKLTEYSEKMGISNQVMEIVGMYIE
jgi:predicted transcriptional regulator of viral defense system